MNSYPHDEFDDVPEDSARRGAYRGEEEGATTFDKSTILIAIVGMLGLLVGAVMFIVQPRTLAPNAEENISAATTPLATPDNTFTEKEIRKPEELTVNIYNSQAYPGAAAEVEQVLLAQGYNVQETGNWTQDALPTSMVYYANGYIAEANELSNGMGIAYFEEDDQSESNLYVVVGPDFAGITSEQFVQGQEVAASETATPAP